MIRKKITNIIKSRLTKGEDLPEWREKRLEECINCIHNSANKGSKSTATNVWDKIVGSHCTLCKCPIESKTKAEGEACPDGRWGVETLPSESMLDISLKNKDTTVYFYRKNNMYHIKYKNTHRGFNSNVTLKIDDDSVEDITIETSCGCTTAHVKDGNLLKVRYDTQRMGGFKKTIRLHYLKDKKRKSTTILIKGEVK